MNKSIFIPVKEIPSKVIDYINDVISRYSVGLVMLDDYGNYSTMASGTLVSVRKRHAILTARHVIDEIKSSDNDLGLVLTGREHKFVLEQMSLEVVCAPRGESTSSGPDMGLIYILSPKLGTIKEMKSFYNLDYCATLIRNELSIPKSGLWFVFGIPEEQSDTKSNPLNFSGQIYHGFRSVLAYPESNGYDYYDFDFRSSHPGRVPHSLGGMSGGGVWHAKVLHKRSTGEVYVPEGSDWLTLSGVNFYESPVSGGGRSLRTHGRKSIYTKLFEWA